MRLTNERREYLRVEHESLKNAIATFETALPIVEQYIGKKITKRITNKIEKETGKILSIDWRFNTPSLIDYNDDIIGSVQHCGYDRAVYAKRYRYLACTLHHDDDNNLLSVDYYRRDLQRYKDSLKTLEITMDQNHQGRLANKYEELKRVNNEFVEMLQGLDRQTDGKYAKIHTLF